jgi:hypothetical protein
LRDAAVIDAGGFIEDSLGFALLGLVVKNQRLPKFVYFALTSPLFKECLVNIEGAVGAKIVSDHTIKISVTVATLFQEGKYALVNHLKVEAGSVVVEFAKGRQTAFDDQVVTKIEFSSLIPVRITLTGIKDDFSDKGLAREF